MLTEKRWGSYAQATHRREGEAGHNVSLEGTMGDTQRSPTISTENQGIAAKVAGDSGHGLQIRQEMVVRC
jgi:hypothetical protein